VSCPRCGEELENYSRVEGGWCPNCQEWFPADLVEGAELEEDW